LSTNVFQNTKIHCIAQFPARTHTEYWVLRKRISAIPNEIFPDGKVKYFLRKYEILLTQYEICPLGILRYHFVMIEIQMGLLYEQLDKLLFSAAPNLKCLPLWGRCPRRGRMRFALLQRKSASPKAINTEILKKFDLIRPSFAWPPSPEGKA
jgi:hypothetical protein